MILKVSYLLLVPLSSKYFYRAFSFITKKLAALIFVWSFSLCRTTYNLKVLISEEKYFLYCFLSSKSLWFSCRICCFHVSDMMKMNYFCGIHFIVLGYHMKYSFLFLYQQYIFTNICKWSKIMECMSSCIVHIMWMIYCFV